MGWETGTGKRFREAPQFNSIFTIIVIMGASIVLLPNLPLIKVMWFSQIINCLLLPVVLIFMLLLINKKELMGEYRNSHWMNIVTYVSTALLICLNLILFYNAFVDTMR